jgi:drug/metabolite transporter (DMT)-like permease
LPIRPFLLILFAATAHAIWNFLAKRFVENKQLIWFASILESLFLIPFVIWSIAAQGFPASSISLLFLLATGVLHLLYTECLLRGYRAGDFTVVYPLARGSAPLLSFAGAVVFLHEHASALAISGALLISLGIVLASGAASSIGKVRSQTSLMWGVATGVTIACYTIVDAYAVTKLMIAPLLVEYAETLFRALALSGKAWNQRNHLRTEFSHCWAAALCIAILWPASYIMALSAMKLAPVSHVAPVREMSMMIGMYLGAKFLQEHHVKRRLIGSALIVGGVAALALG